MKNKVVIQRQILRGKSTGKILFSGDQVLLGQIMDAARTSGVIAFASHLDTMSSLDFTQVALKFLNEENK